MTPDSLSPAAADEWAATIQPMLDAGMIGATDASVAMAYCEAVGRLSMAQAVSARMAADSEYGGFLVEDGTGKLVQNPMLKIVDAAWREVVYYAGELRMTPKSR